jgi:pimeloyl-ACP methyl ester carboxylesterase
VNVVVSSSGSSNRARTRDFAAAVGQLGGGKFGLVKDAPGTFVERRAVGRQRDTPSCSVFPKTGIILARTRPGSLDLSSGPMTGVCRASDIRRPGGLMLRTLIALTMAALPMFARGAIEPYPPSFQTTTIQTNGTSLYVRSGGKGPAVVLLHGFGDTGDMWAPLAAVLVKDHTVIVPDLRGMGLSAHPDAGYTKKNQALDIAGVMDALKVERAALITHDIGNMVGYALAVQFPKRIIRWVVIDAPLPGVGNWDNIVRSPLLWHFNFRGPDVERLVQGRERIYLDRFYNELSADPKRIDEQTRQHYAELYAKPQAMHDAFEQFGAFAQDAADNKALLASNGKLSMPVLAVGAEKSFGLGMADELRFVATDVTGAVIPASGHWIMEENPQATTALVTGFIAK